MAKPYDATTKFLIEVEPRDLLAFVGINAPDVEVLNDVDVMNSDLATVTAEADKVIRVNGPKPFLTHVEAQAVMREAKKKAAKRQREKKL